MVKIFVFFIMGHNDIIHHNIGEIDATSSNHTIYQTHIHKSDLIIMPFFGQNIICYYAVKNPRMLEQILTLNLNT